MPPSLEAPSTSTHETYPSLTETSSVASSDLPRTASEIFSNSPLPWRGTTATTDDIKDHSDRTSSPRFAKRLFRLVGTSGAHHHPSLSAPTNSVELSEYAARHAHQADTVRSQARPTRPKPQEEEETAWSWNRTSLAHSATSPASERSSLGPLPIFARPHNQTISRHSSLSKAVASVRQQQDDQDQAQETHSHHQQEAHSTEREAPLPELPRIAIHRPTKSRPSLASLFQSAGRKALHRDDFRKDSYGKTVPTDDSLLSSSVPSTPLRRRFLGLRSSNAGDTIRSAKSTPPPIPSYHIPTPSLPIITVPTPKSQNMCIPPSPMLRRKRSSLPIPPKKPIVDDRHDHHYNEQQTEYEMMTGQSFNPPSDLLEVPKRVGLRRSNSDHHRGKRSHSPGQATSIRVPGPPPQHHPHPHPFFPCDGPLDRGLLSLPSFDFERPATRPSTPGQSQEFLPIERGKRSRSRATDVESEMTAEIKSVLAAGAEARRERRAPSRERLRVIEPMHRQHLPDVTGGDDQLSPDPSPDPRSLTHPIPIPASGRARSHLSHGLLPFESPAATPYGSRIDLPLLTPPPTAKSRRSAQPQPSPTQPTNQTHHRHFSSSATAVAPPVPPKEKVFIPFDDRRSELDGEMGLLKRIASPQLFSGGKPAQEKRAGSGSSSSHDYHRRGSSLNQTYLPYRQGSGDSKNTPISPTSYRTNHFHSHSLSGSTAVQGGGHYPTPAQSPAGLGILLFPEPPPLSRQDRYFDLKEAMKLSIGDSRYKSFERAIRKYNDHAIPLQGPGGVFDRVQRLLNEAVDDGLPSQTARKYYQAFQTILTEA